MNAEHAEHRTTTSQEIEVAQAARLRTTVVVEDEMYVVLGRVQAAADQHQAGCAG
ncbi:hypothetical protein [Streptomyces sp. NPDC046985]|uniref:hypothetical protein n=1 Tax=Streptomyces sp. NPDC046985 TaxID=3155377 RepID=UPI0033E3ACC4